MGCNRNNFCGCSNWQWWWQRAEAAYERGMAAGRNEGYARGYEAGYRAGCRACGGCWDTCECMGDCPNS